MAGEIERSATRWVRLGCLLAAVAVVVPACSGGEPGAAEAPSESEPTAPVTASSPGGRLTPHPAGDTDAPLGYYEYLPPGYGDGEPVPLLVALHGFGGNGDGSAAQLDNIFEAGVPALIRSDSWSADLPFVVLMPQHLWPDGGEDWCAGVTSHFASCAMAAQSEHAHPEGMSPCTTPSEVDAFLSYALGTYDVDPDRVYLTGLSCGAYAVYEYLAEHGPSTVAAAVAIAGDARPAWDRVGCELGAVPIWAFVGDADDEVLPDGSIEPLEGLAACTDPPAVEAQLTVYPGVDHNSWDATYDLSAGHDIYAWLLQRSRGS